MFWSLFLFWGCPGSPQTDTGDITCIDRGEVTLQIGSGEEGLVLLEESDSVLIERGPQGGFHIWAGFLATGIHPGNLEKIPHPANPELTFSLVANDKQIAGYEGAQRVLEILSEESIRHTGEQLILSINDLSEVAEQPAVLSIEIYDACGAEIQEQRSIILTLGKDP